MGAVALCLAVPAVAQQAQRARLSEVEANLRSSKEDEAALAEQMEANRKHLDKLAERSRNLAASLQETEARVGEQEVNAGKLSDELAAKQKEFDARRDEYARTIVSLLALHRLPATAIFASPENIHPLLRTASVLQHTNDSLAVRAAALKRQMDELAMLRKRTAASTAALAKERASLVGQQQALGSEVAARQDAQDKLGSDRAKAQQRVAELTRQSSSLQDLIGRLEAEPEMGHARHAHGDFGSAKGNLRAPAVGEIVHRFGERKNENESWRGIVVAARAGGTVVAPWGGEVVFTGPFMDYGRIVLLKHGNGYISLLAGLGAIDVALNQEVRAGEPLGRMPASPSPTLYVELRDHSKPIDPTGWFANVGRTLAKS
ncbi:MAG: peptidoglycan DD-metalloendopeptidase family protein [Alphaproteobacteria bacterium]